MRAAHSYAVRDDMEKTCADCLPPIRYKAIPRPCETRWNTIAALLDGALPMADAIDKVVLHPQHNKQRKNRLSRFRMTLQQWQLADELRGVLVPFLEATDLISTGTNALLHEVIPIMDTLTRHLDDVYDRESTSPLIRLAVAMGRRILDKYYSKTDASIMYRAAMILNPFYKLSYFQKLAWPQEWVQEAIDIVTDYWVDHYKPPPPDSTSHHRTSTISRGEGFFSDLRSFHSDDSPSDALADYLRIPRLPTVQDPIKYWLQIGYEEPLSTLR